jgi:hypothetical protein
MPRDIEAEIVYFAPPTTVAKHERPSFVKLPLAPARMPIRDMRGRESRYSLDEQGFMVASAPTEVRDFRDTEEIARVYLPEVDALLRDVTGCSATAVSTPGLRRVSKRGGAPPPGVAGTGNFAHADYSYTSGDVWLRRALTPEEADARLQKRYSIFNVWRTFSEPPQDVPLALCDARSVEPDDIQNCTITLGEMTWENTTYLHNEDHRWSYCSDMTRDEAYIFRSFDSDPARKVHVPHTAFEDKSCPDDAPPRESFELRVFAFYD